MCGSGSGLGFLLRLALYLFNFSCFGIIFKCRIHLVIRLNHRMTEVLDIFFNVKFIFLVIIGQLLVLLMLSAA